MTVEALEIKRRVETETKGYRAECGDLSLTADVTTTNGTVSAIDDIRIYEDGTHVWAGAAHPNISGSFLRSGREPEVITLLAAFIAEVRKPRNDD